MIRKKHPLVFVGAAAIRLTVTVDMPKTNEQLIELYEYVVDEFGQEPADGMLSSIEKSLQFRGILDKTGRRRHAPKPVTTITVDDAVINNPMAAAEAKRIDTEPAVKTIPYLGKGGLREQMLEGIPDAEAKVAEAKTQLLAEIGQYTLDERSKRAARKAARATKAGVGQTSTNSVPL